MGKKNRKKNNKNIMKMGGSKDNNNNNNEKEDRFDAAETRPQFRPVKKQQTKVVLDERFSSVLTDPRFELHAKDKYGRRSRNNNNKQINKKDMKKKKKNGNNNNKEDLGMFYTIEEKQQNEENNGDDEKEYKPHQNDYDNDSDGSDSQSNAGSSNDDDDDDVDERSNNEEDPASRIAYLTAFSRGEIDMSSSSSSDDDDDDDSSASDASSDGGGNDNDSSDDNDNDDGEEDPVYGTAGVLDPSTKASAEEEIEISYDPSPYLVVADMDWDHIRAVDLFVILSSFTPPGSVKKVQIFQSDFGIQQMKKDKLYGPSDIWKKNKNKKNKATTTANNSGRDDKKENDDSDSESSAASSSDDDSEEEKEEDYEVSDDEEEEPKLNIDYNDQLRDNDFDPEKLRAYEASKLKYYFAVVEFADPDHADIAYREIDGQEFEHSSAAIDLRTLPPDQVAAVVTNRPMRDEATSVPGDYEPPEFVVSALQQTNVECTWDQGDADRERKLTKYGSGGGWQNLAETDDLKAYLASDGSSDDESDEEMAAEKGANMRKLLGLDNSDDDDDDEEEEEEEQENIRSGSEDEGSTNDKCMEIKYIPGKAKLEEKIRSKLQSKGDEEKEPEELTPWEKYKEKRRLKRRERRQAARGGGSNKQGEDVDGPQRSTRSKKRNDEIDEDASENSDNADDDDFLIGDGKKRPKKSSKTKDDKKTEKANEELELLLAGEADEEEERDYDIRGIQRLEKNKGKKLRGSRKRKEDKIAADVTGTEFQVNVNDSRFAAVMEGSDARFGIDKTDPNYKDTSGMREILAAQTTRRKKKRKKQLRADNKNPDDVVVAPPDVSAEQSGHSAGSNALSSLVQRLKSNVAKSSLV